MRRWTQPDPGRLVVALVGAASLARLTTGGAPWRGVVVATLVAYTAVTLSTRRIARSWSLIIGVLAAALASVWLAVPAATRDGLPTATTFRTLDHGLKAIGPIHLPITGGPGVVLLCSLVAGMAAAATKALPGLFGFVPSLVLLAGSTVAHPSDGAALLAVLLAAGMTMAIGTADGRVSALACAATTAAVAVAVVAVSIANEPAGAVGGGKALVGVPPTAISLVSRLTALEVRDPDLVMFTAKTPVPTYWQVAVLSVLTGQTWGPDSAVSAVLSGRHAVPTPMAKPTGPTFSVTVSIANFSSRLLPIPPSTVRVSPGTLTSVGAVAPLLSQAGQRYDATATIPDATTSSGATASPEDTALPILSPAITALAGSITASAPTPLDKAEALTDWFRSPSFHYSLRPTRADLTSFLLTTRTGSCEQFAGAFAVLARSVGLPTRVAVGFATGVRNAAGRTVVRGMDAHVWPQVLFAGTWLSFEPTPALPSGELTPPGVIGVTAVGAPNPIGSITTPSSVPPLSFPPPPTGSAAPRVGSSPFWWWFAVGVAGTLALVGVALRTLGRRRRRRLPGGELATAWNRVDRALDRTPMARPRWRTPAVHARMLAADAKRPDFDTALGDLEWLATHLEEHIYGGIVDDSVTRQAHEVSERIVTALKAVTT